MSAFEFIGPDDKAALLGLSGPNYSVPGRHAVVELGYKTHQVASHEEFLEKFAQVQYEVVLLEENFDAASGEENRSLATLQSMQMGRRRHATIILLGESFQTMDPMQAFAKGVHAVIHTRDLDKLKDILQQVVNDNALFLNVFKQAQSRMAQGRK